MLDEAWTGVSLVLLVVLMAEFYLIPWLNKTQGSLGTEVGCLENIGLLPSQWVVLKKS